VEISINYTVILGDIKMLLNRFAFWFNIGMAAMLWSQNHIGWALICIILAAAQVPFIYNNITDGD